MEKELSDLVDVDSPDMGPITEETRRRTVLYYQHGTRAMMTGEIPETYESIRKRFLAAKLP